MFEYLDINVIKIKILHLYFNTIQKSLPEFNSSTLTTNLISCDKKNL